jgi:hypothetical protein
VFEGFAAECWLIGDVQGKVDGYDLAGSDLFCCCCYACRCKKV